jgi:8-oxo-dGTP pyrophosphatase MutT (NUDIX family)
MAGQGDPDVIRDVRLVVDGAGCMLDDAAHLAIRGLFRVAAAARGGPSAAMQAVAPEYGRPEYLANVDQEGNAVLASQDALRDYRDLARREPAFRHWFQEAEIPGAGPVLLPARWLCHLAGLRHPTVQLFIDDAVDPRRTLMQVRGLSRPEAPGRFDIPVAGHVPGTARPEAALARELFEELGLTLDDITPPEPLGGYEHVEGLDGPFRNNEFRTVFRCRLRTGSLARVRFLDAEVAALCLFDIAELAVLIDRFPGRIASGLLLSFPRYYGAAAVTGTRGG